MNERRLYRSRNERRIAGVAGGLAEHFMIDPVIIRIIFVCLFLCGLSGALIYLILWIVLPEQPHNINNESQDPFINKEESKTTDNINSNTINMEAQNNETKEPEKRRGSANLTGGIILITLGVLFLCERFIPNIDFGDLWPILLIVIGITIMFRGNSSCRRNKNKNKSE